MNRRDPFTDVEELVERVDQELGKIGASFELPGGRRMPVDVVDGPDAVTVAADLPGYEEEFITVEFDDDVLTITATPANDDGEAINNDGEASHDGESPSGDERTYQIRERRHGSVSRRVPVGATVDAAGATAAYDAGVLTVTLPKRSAADTHRIDVE
jgi:HSP20 family protein